MANQPRPQPLEEVVNKMRDNILRTQSQASTTAITSFDSMIEQLKVFVFQINDKNTEITRLQELCKKNNIDYAVPPAGPKTPKVETPQKPTNTKA